jgi:ketosteroid isomerase-like protein
MKSIRFTLLTTLMTVAAVVTTMAQTPADNKRIIKAGFDRWAQGTGSFFDLLTDDMQWTITGSTPLSKTYAGKRQFMDEVINPLNQRLSKKIVPTVRAVYAEGDMVIALMDGQATAKDNKPYNMSYAWFMQMKGGKIIKVTAFLDGIQFTDVMQRLKGNN